MRLGLGGARAGVCILALLATLGAAIAQPARAYRVGVIYHGGPAVSAVEGLREGLRELGWEEGRHYALVPRDAKGDLTGVETAARELERDKVDLIYAVTSGVTIAVKRATTRVPIVFYTGSDPVASGLVESFRKPGGRLTGTHGQGVDLTAKRLELLKEILPKLRRVVTFYNPDNHSSAQSVRNGRDAARRLNVDFVERQIRTAEDLRTGLHALRPGEVDAFFYVAGALVTSQTDAIIDTARAKKLPTMFSESSSVARGALAAYGISYRAVGRLSAKQVQRVLQGTAAGELPIEQLDKPHLALNLRTAKAIGVTILPSALARADEVIE